MRANHNKHLGSLLRVLCATAIMTAIPSAYSLSGEPCEIPAFKWVGSNGAIGGTRHESGGGRSGLAVAPDGGVWVADRFYPYEAVDIDWDPTATVLVRPLAGSFDSSISLVNGDGGLIRNYALADTEWETIIGVAGFRNYVLYCGTFSPQSQNSYTLDFDITDGIDLHTSNTRRGTGDSYASIVSVDRGVPRYEWTVTFGGPASDSAYAVAADDTGVWVAGHFYEAIDLDPGPQEEWFSSNGNDDVYLLKLSWNGEFMWAVSFGGLSSDSSYSVQVDSEGNGYVLGVFNGAVDFDPGPGEDWFTADRNDIFLSKYTADGEYVWTRVWEPNLTPTGYGLSTDGNDRLLIDGFFEESMDVDPGPGEHWLTARGDDDAVNGLLLMLNSDGEYLWSRQIGGPGELYVSSATFDRDGHVIAAGHFRDEVDFNDAGPPDIHASRGGLDPFLSRFSPDGEYEWTIPWGGPEEEDSTNFVVAHENGDITVSGYFQGTVDFDPGEGVHELTAVGVRDMFLLRLGCADECAQLRKHRAKGGDGQIKSKVVADAALGRVTVECTGPSGPHRRRADLDAAGRGKVRLRRLAPGEYECAVTKLEDAAGASLCEGAFLPRRVTVE